MRDILIIILPSCILFSCQPFSDRERVIISKANSVVGEMRKYHTEKAENTFSLMEDLVAGNGNRPKDLATLKQAKDLKQSFDELFAMLIQSGNDGRLPSDSVKKFNSKLGSLKNKIDWTYRQAELKDTSVLYLPSSGIIGPGIEINTLMLSLTNLQYNLMNFISQEIGSTDIRCFLWSIYPFVEEESKVVEEGNSYKAGMFLCTAFSSLGYKVKFRDSTIRSQDQIAQIKFKVQGGDYDSTGLCRKSWDAELQYHEKGRIKSVPVHREYYVRKPCR